MTTTQQQFTQQPTYQEYVSNSFMNLAISLQKTREEAKNNANKLMWGKSFIENVLEQPENNSIVCDNEEKVSDAYGIKNKDDGDDNGEIGDDGRYCVYSSSYSNDALEEVEDLTSQAEEQTQPIWDNQILPKLQEYNLCKEEIDELKTHFNEMSNLSQLLTIFD